MLLHHLTDVCVCGGGHYVLIDCVFEVIAIAKVLQSEQLN